jgi:hypothetical protein
MDIAALGLLEVELTAAVCVEDVEGSARLFKRTKHLAQCLWVHRGAFRGNIVFLHLHLLLRMLLVPSDSGCVVRSGSGSGSSSSSSGKRQGCMAMR